MSFIMMFARVSQCTIDCCDNNCTQSLVRVLAYNNSIIRFKLSSPPDARVNCGVVVGVVGSVAFAVVVVAVVIVVVVVIILVTSTAKNFSTLAYASSDSSRTAVDV
jgi:hypothetical protein